VIHEFLRELANHLEADEELDIQTAGVIKKLGRTDVVIKQQLRWLATAAESTQ
jgi:hypothetical protein